MELRNVGAERAWGATVLALVVALVGGSLLFPREVYAGFVWHYFWGPVYADAHGAACVVWDGGRQALLGSSQACAATSGIVAYPGYTAVSEVGYMLVLLLALVGVVFLLRRLDVGTSERFFYGLVPFVFFGGALRVVEDADNAVPAGAGGVINYPWNALIISPIIYFTMFFLTLAALLASLWLARTGRTDSYERPLFAAGCGLLVLSLGYLVWLAATTTYVGFYPQVTVLTLLVATLATAATWRLARAYLPEVAAGTGLIGATVIWGHAVDGAANVLLLDWGPELGVGVYTPKHPVNQAIVNLTQSLLPASVTDVVGAAWPFLPVKLLAATLAVWLFNEDVLEESPRYTLLLLLAILAVGLGPGTRDMLRATFGI